MIGITLDGTLYRVRLVYNTMNRRFSLEGGTNEGYMLDRSHERDLIGTRYSYQMGIEPDPRYPQDYDAFYEAISAPVDSHTISLPYGQGSIEFDAEIDDGEDTWGGRIAGVNRWSGLKIDFTPISLQRMANDVSQPTVSGGVPVGAILIWSGTAAQIPDGWALCDGQDGRPDLRDKFVLGGGGTHAVGDTGGSETVGLTGDNLPSISLKFPATAIPVENGDIGTSVFALNAAPQYGYSGEGAPHSNMPPYYTLCYIIKTAAN